MPKQREIGTPIKTIKIPLRFQSEKLKIFMKKMFGIARKTYNHLVAITNNDYKLEKTKKNLRSLVINDSSPFIQENPWVKECGYDIRDDSLKSFLTSLKGNFTKKKEGIQKKFQMHFRSIKKLKSESILFRSRWIKIEGKRIIMKWPKGPEISFPLKDEITSVLCDCRVKRTNLNQFYLCIPQEYDEVRVETQDPEIIQKPLRICSCDPGVRTFQTIYNVNNGEFIEVGNGDIRRIFRLCKYCDNLQSQIDNATDARRRYMLKRV